MTKNSTKNSKQNQTKNTEKKSKKVSAEVEPKQAKKSSVKVQQNTVSSSEILDLQTQIKELEDKNLRLHAEMQNVQKQHQMDTEQAKKVGKKVALMSMLEFLNTLNISFAFVPETDDKKVVDFVATLKKSFSKVSDELKSVNVEIINPVQGDSFDPEVMHALNEPADDNPTIKQVVNIGLRVDGQLIQAVTVML